MYAGVVANGNGDETDETNVVRTHTDTALSSGAHSFTQDSTFLRGIQKTDEDGVAQWLSIFPGHYTGRTTHVHIMAHQDGTVFDNGTFVSDTVRHVGQVFFDQDLITAVEATETYNTNTQELTTNSEDSIMSEEATDIDPVLEYVLLGDSVEDGLMLWGAIGIDTTAAYTVSAAATLTEDGGVMNESSGMGGAPSGEAPSGVPSGAAPPDATASA